MTVLEIPQWESESESKRGRIRDTPRAGIFTSSLMPAPQTGLFLEKFLAALIAISRLDLSTNTTTAVLPLWRNCLSHTFPPSSSSFSPPRFRFPIAHVLLLVSPSKMTFSTRPLPIAVNSARRCAAWASTGTFTTNSERGSCGVGCFGECLRR